MKRLLVCLQSVLLLAALTFAGSMPLARGAQPEHAVIFIIDRLSYKALSRLPLKNLQALAARGTYYEKSNTVLPAHPVTGEWARHHRSSIPNPVIFAGTFLLRPDQKYVQESFFPDRITANAVNDDAYTAFNVGFNLTFQAGPMNGGRANDGQTIVWAIEFLRKVRPAFMRVHLQDTGSAGFRCYAATDRSLPWWRNIWGEGSPYTKAAVQADECLGMFSNELKALGLLEKTVLFVTADHGEADRGWHTFTDEDGWAMPLVLAGPGIRQGQKFDYAEQIDIVPTLCHLMRVKPPENADGRTLAEALVEAPRSAPRKCEVRELNKLLLEGDALLGKLRHKVETEFSLRPVLIEAEHDFYGVERILEWHRFGSLDKLLEHNRHVVERVSAAMSGTQ